MAIEFDVVEYFENPPITVFGALTDLDHMGSWMPGFVRMERVSGPGFHVGTEFRETRKFFGKEATEQFEVTSISAPDHIGLTVDGTQGASKRGKYVFDYYLEPERDGTRVMLHGEIQGLRGPMALLGKLMIRPYKKACAKDLEALREYLGRSQA